jgi:hypothetical protein
MANLARRMGSRCAVDVDRRPHGTLSYCAQEPLVMPPTTPVIPHPRESVDSHSSATLAWLVRTAEACAYTSCVATAVGASLSLAASRMLDAPQSLRWAFLAAAGTFIIYNLDRLRDVERDHSTSPLRTAFVMRNRRSLYACVGLASIGFGVVLLSSPPRIILLCTAIGLVGLFHRRAKNAAATKTAYVSIAWVASCVGMPWLASHREGDLALWVAGVILTTLVANLMASNLRDGEAGAIRGRTAPILWGARAMTLFGIGIAFAAPERGYALAWIPACQALPLALFLPTERFGHLAVDGALLLGALATLVHLESLG